MKKLSSLVSKFKKWKNQPKVSSNIKGTEIKVLTDGGLYILGINAASYALKDNLIIVEEAGGKQLASIQLESADSAKILLGKIYAKKQSILKKALKIGLFVIIFSFVWEATVGVSMKDDQGVSTPYEFGKELDFTEKPTEIPKDEGGHDEYGLPTQPFSD